MRMQRFPLALAGVLAAATAAHAADQRIYSYEPADQATRQRVDQGLTLVMDKGMFSMTVREVLATQARATAVLRPAHERDLGERLDRILPKGAWGNDIYAVTEREQGPGMVRAFCPGSSKGWLVITPPKARRPVHIHALGDDPASGKARYCTTLNLNFRGEWKLPDVGRTPTMQPVPPPVRPF